MQPEEDGMDEHSKDCKCSTCVGVRFIMDDPFSDGETVQMIEMSQYRLLESRIADLDDEIGKLKEKLKNEREHNRALVDELKLCNRSRKWWKSLAYEANAEKISCRAATIKRNDEDKQALKDAEGG